jgi:hypothetical protein
MIGDESAAVLESDRRDQRHGDGIFLGCGSATNVHGQTTAACTPDWVKPLALEEIESTLDRFFSALAWLTEEEWSGFFPRDVERAQSMTPVARLEWAIEKARGR